MTPHMGGFLWGYILLRWRFDFLVDAVRERGGCECQMLVERAASLGGGNDAQVFLEHTESISAWKASELDEPYLVGFWRAKYHFFAGVPRGVDPVLFNAARSLIPIEWIKPAIASGYRPAMDFFVQYRNFFEPLSDDEFAKIVAEHYMERYILDVGDQPYRAKIKVGGTNKEEDERLACRGDWGSMKATREHATDETRVFWSLAESLMTSRSVLRSPFQMHCAKTSVENLSKFDKYQLLVCIHQARKLATLGDLMWLSDIIIPWTRDWRKMDVSPSEIVKWLLNSYDNIQERIRAAIDAWSICAMRLGLVHDARRLVAEMTWHRNRHEWSCLSFLPVDTSLDSLSGGKGH